MNSSENNVTNAIIEVSVEDIIPNRFQPRLAFDEKALKDLSESIKIHGIIQPLVLRKLNDKFEIIAGERRYKAACMAGLTKVPAIIKEIDDNKSAEIAVVENLQRKNLTAIEEAQSYKKILDKGYITQEELAARMGVSQPTIANKLRLLNLSQEVQDALLGNKISERHARSLLAITDQNIQVQMLRRIISERLTVRQTDEEISKLLGKPISSPISSEEKTNIFDTNNTNNNPTLEMPKENNTDLEPIETFANPTLNDNIFNVNTDEIKSHSEDIIKTPEPANIDMLLKKENEIEDQRQFDPVPPKKINLEETEANVNMGDIVDESKVPFNPFIEPEKPEIMDFFTPSATPQPDINSSNSIINEFREMKAESSAVETPQQNTNSNFSTAINTSRDTINKLRNLGLNVESEEFDFEDMYQIIIKIKKD